MILCGVLPTPAFAETSPHQVWIIRPSMWLARPVLHQAQIRQSARGSGRNGLRGASHAATKTLCASVRSHALALTSCTAAQTQSTAVNCPSHLTSKIVRMFLVQQQPLPHPLPANGNGRSGHSGAQPVAPTLVVTVGKSVPAVTNALSIPPFAARSHRFWMNTPG